MARIFALFFQQPRSFFMIFLLEVWERFGYYTVQGILILYFIRFLGFSESVSYYTFGAFTALIYGMVVIGGYLGDNILGTKRTILLGLIVLAIGYLSLALADKDTVFLALGTICVGNGLFKANPSSLLAKCYTDNDETMYSGFTLYYMAINLGAFASLFIGPYLSSNYGYFYAYFASFIGISLGIANYFFQYSIIANIKTGIDEKPISLLKGFCILIGIFCFILLSAYLIHHIKIAETIVWLIIGLTLIVYVFFMFHVNPVVKAKMFLALLLMLEAVVFFTLYQQMPTSLNLFAVHNMEPILFGIPIDPQSFQALNPIWIIVLSPILAFLYQYLERNKYSFRVPYKFALGMTSCACGFLILFCSRFFSIDGIVSSYWIVTSYFFQSLGELLVSALGVAMVTELVPKKISGFVMGMWFTTSSIASFIGAWVASFTALPNTVTNKTESLLLYTQVFAYIGLATLLISILMWVVSPWLTRLMRDDS